MEDDEKGETAADAVTAVWAICSPEAWARAQTLPNSPGWKELRGSDTWVYVRLTRSAARALAEQLLRCAEADARDVATGRPQGTYQDGVVDEPFGFYLHPAGASLSFEVAGMAPIDELLIDKNSSYLLSPSDANSEFKR